MTDYTSYSPPQIIAAYRTAYRIYYRREADECRYNEGDWYVINGIPRQRSWLEMETQRLETLADQRAEKDDPEASTRRGILRMIRKLARL